MIFKHELVEKIRFKHIKETHEITEDHNRAFDSIIGEAIVLKGENYDIEDVAGTIKAHCFNLVEFEGSVEDLLDPISATVAEFIPFFNEEYEIDKKVFETLNIKVNEETLMSSSDAFIIFDTLNVKKEYRGKGIGKLLIQSTCNDYRRDARLAFLKAYPLQYQGVDSWTSEEKKSREKKIKEFKERDLNQSRDKLVILYKSCGFKLIKGTKEFMVADLWNYIA